MSQKNVCSSFAFHPAIVDPDDRLIFILFAENVFMIDFISAKVDSFKGVTNLQYHNDWIIREIDERLLLHKKPDVFVV